MAVKITLTNPSVPKDFLTSTKEDHTSRMSRSIYQHLGSLAKNKKILEDYQNNTIPLELRTLFDKFAELSDLVNTDANARATFDQEILNLDEYLGSLGMGTEYIYDKDRVDIEAWVDVNTQDISRLVVDRATGSSLIDRATGAVIMHDTTK